ncbi:hypothetical protein CUMW_063520 [Citrus unshiu]|nr:hypothetical protein CUMW_063520 [Citrus unshiu]
MDADTNNDDQIDIGINSSSSSKLVLYSYWQSSCSWRVRFALKLKGLIYEYKAVDLSKGEQFSPEFEELNPLHFVPVLVDGDVVVSDSYAILLYLEEKYPQRALLPAADPQQRALNLQAASIISSSMQPLHMLSLLKYIEDKFGPDERLLWVQTHIEKGFLEVADRFCCQADVFLAPQIAVVTMRFNIDMSKFPTLLRIYESYKGLPEFLASSPERQPDAALLAYLVNNTISVPISLRLSDKKRDEFSRPRKQVEERYSSSNLS